jgi:HK97 family phage major capsid protein
MSVTTNGTPRPKVAGERTNEPVRTGRSRKPKLANLALQGWCRHQSNRPATKEQRSAMKKCGFDPDADEISLRLRSGDPEARALAVNANTAGGYVVPEDFGQWFERAMLLTSPVRKNATVVNTRGGGPMPWPTVNETVQATEGIIVEDDASAVLDATGPPFGQVVLGAYKFSSKILLVPNELLEDAAPRFVEFLATLAGDRIARAQNRSFTIGNGVSQPAGIVGQAASVQAASATAIAGDDVYNLINAVDPAYREAEDGTQAAFMMSGGIEKLVRELKDGSARYLFYPRKDPRLPVLLAGYRVIFNYHMVSAPVSGARSILFGAFNKVLVRDVRELRLRVLSERYADADQTAFLALFRSDSTILDAGTHPIAALQH